MNAVIRVYTFKEGLLSKLAHDLLLNVSSFEVVVDGDDVRGEFDPASLEVLGAMRDGVLAEGSLSDSDKDKIVESIRGEVLRVRHHPLAQLTAKATRAAEAVQLSGTLVLCGLAQPIALSLRAREGRLQGELELRPSDYGVRPFRALAGALKVQDRVRIQIDAQAPEMTEDARLVWTTRS